MSGAHQGVFMNLRSFLIERQLWSWGRNRQGELGLGDTTYGDNFEGYIPYTSKARSSPVQVGALTTWDGISAGSYYGTVGITTSGTLFGWGGGRGASGHTDLAARSSPTQVGALTNWKRARAAVSTSQPHCIAVKTDGTLWAWGGNYNGQLGRNNTNGSVNSTSASPTQIGSLTTWAFAESGPRVSAAVTTSGTLFTWGRNNNGILGLGDASFDSGYPYYTLTTADRSSPVQVGALTDWAKVFPGYVHCIAVKTNGTLWGWGTNTSGQLGLNNTISRSSPVQIGALTTWAAAACGNQSFTIALTTSGTMFAFGNSQAALGLNQSPANNNRSSPVQIGALTNWAQITAGNDNAGAVKTTGEAWMWGNRQFGKNNNSANYAESSSPVQIGAATNWKFLDAGFQHTVGLRSP